MVQDCCYATWKYFVNNQNMQQDGKSIAGEEAVIKSQR